MATLPRRLLKLPPLTVNPFPLLLKVLLDVVAAVAAVAVVAVLALACVILETFLASLAHHPGSFHFLFV